MDQEVADVKVNVGDTVEIVSNKVGQSHRRGEVDRVVQDDPLRIEVTWDDGHVSLIEPTGGNLRVIAAP